MITLQNNDKVEGNPELRVFVDSGTYYETDLIECYHVNNPSVPHCMMQAQKIKYGDLVYHQDVPLTEEQINAIKAGEAVSAVVANERFKDGFKRMPMREGRIIRKGGLYKGLTNEEIRQAREEIEEDTSTTRATSTDPVNDSPEPIPEPNPEPELPPLPTPDPVENATTTTQSSTTTEPVLPDETILTVPPIADPRIDEAVIITEPILQGPVLEAHTSTQPVLDSVISSEAPVSRIRSKKTAGKIARRVVSKLKKI